MRRSYDYQGFSSSIIEACEHCGRFVSGDDLEADRHGHERCPACQEGTCANCWSEEAAEGSNLCEWCLTRHGVEALWGLVESSQALRLQVRGQPRPMLGFLREVSVCRHALSLLLFMPRDVDDAEGRIVGARRWVPVDAVERVEACGEFEVSGRPGEQERRRLFAWISREEDAADLERSLGAPSPQADGDDEIAFADDAEEEEIVFADHHEDGDDPMGDEPRSGRG